MQATNWTTIRLKFRRLGRARLVSFRTADGFWNVKVDKATIGKEYQVDLDTRRRQLFFNEPTGKYFECEVIDCWDEASRSYIHFPTELLAIEEHTE